MKVVSLVFHGLALIAQVWNLYSKVLDLSSRAWNYVWSLELVFRLDPAGFGLDSGGFGFRLGLVASTTEPRNTQAAQSPEKGASPKAA